MCTFIQPLCHEQHVTHGQFLNSKVSLNSGFSFSLSGCLIKVKALNLLNYLSIDSERRDELMLLSMSLALFKN